MFEVRLQAMRSKLRFANRWVDLHAATAERCGGLGQRRSGGLCEVPIGGPGTPTLAAFGAEPFGAALGISTLSAMNLISVAVELKHRLPGLWALSEDLGSAGVEAEAGRPPHLDDLIAALVTPVAEGGPVRRPPRIRTRDLQLYVHLPAADLDSTGRGGIATVEGLGAVTVARIEDWLARHTAAGGRVRVTPVVDPERTDAVDRHDPPP